MPNHDTAGKFLRIAAMLVICLATVAAQGAATLRGQINDQLGGAISGASVTLVNELGKPQTVETDERGIYRFSGLAPGTYTLRATHHGFANYERADLSVKESQTRTFDFQLAATVGQQRLNVQSDEAAADPNNNKDATSIKGKDLDSLPDDPDDLVDALSALAGPAAGPSGAEVYVDGFTSAAPVRTDKQAIREIVVNRNPFSAEYDQIGFARIDVVTKPGTGKIHGGTDFNFNDSLLNSRNPYADFKPSSQRRIYAGNVSGPLSSRASFFASINRRELDENAILNAIAVDDSLNIVNFREITRTPERYLLANPRFDFQLNGSNALRVSYNYSWADQPRWGIGGIEFPSQVYHQNNTVHQLNLTETAILNSRVVTESRFQYFQWKRIADRDHAGTVVEAIDSFAIGGPDLNRSDYVQNEIEFHNYTTMTARNHTLKFGGRLRAAWVRESDDLNRQGIYFFAGSVGPQLDQNNRVVLGPDGRPGLTVVSTVEAYRRTLLFQGLGLSPQRIRELGGGATRFVIAEGDPVATTRQADFGGFGQDDWRLRPDFTLSFGLRYQAQNHADSSLNFAPRMAFAWAPFTNNAGRLQTVVRGGAGIFYDLVGTGRSLQADHWGGSHETRFVVVDPALLDFFPNVPPPALFETQPRKIIHLAPDLKEPYSVQFSISVEQSLPFKTVMTISYLHARGVHLLRERDINAALPGTPASSGVGPFGTIDQIIQHESSGKYRQNLLIINSTIKPTARLSFSASYALGFTNSDAEGLPNNPYDLAAEYSRSGIDQRHRFILNSTVVLPGGINLNPFVLAQSGTPFNITIGQDINNDLEFTDRPAFATDLKKPSVVVSRFGAFDLAPEPGQRIIPRNFGENPGYFSVNLRASRTFVFGGVEKASGNGQSNKQDSARSYKMTVGLYAVNLFNRTNQGSLFGALTSPFFGLTNSLTQVGQRSPSSNRNISVIMSFNF
jgi:Carboxypeptidase regulatory-like domain/TonB dependent receptor